MDHLRQLRALQDEARAKGFGVPASAGSEPPEGGTPNHGGFVGFVPLPYQPENNDIPVKTPPTGFDALRTIAVSRIYLDNFDHITAYWVGMGMKLAQVALSCGADARLCSCADTELSSKHVSTNWVLMIARWPST